MPVWKFPLQWTGRKQHHAPQTSALKLEEKASRAKSLITLHSSGQPRWAPRNYLTFAQEGFAQNAICYRCVRMIAEATASLTFQLWQDDEVLPQHPMLDLLNKPNSRQCGPDLMEEWVGHLLVAGNSYLELVTLEDIPRELHVLRPDRMKVILGADGWAGGYEYSVEGRSLKFENAPEGEQSPILHQALFHPANDHYGMSPIEAAASAIDIHNAASSWNKALLDNSARPSGALVYTSNEGELSSDQYERLRDELRETFEGPANAGRPLLLEGGLDWKNMGLTPRDMDFIEAKYIAAREIALALGVPPLLLGIPGDNSYANYAEANRSFWRQTVVPLAEKAAKSLSHWLSPSFGDGLCLKPDLENAIALRGEQETLWKRLSEVDYLTTDEKRALIGYPPLEPAVAPMATEEGNAE
ncbi:MAG: portal protein [Rhodomicrobium sp.]|nr:MAG: portal protein [Rhodomicrobium sp.]